MNTWDYAVEQGAKIWRDMARQDAERAEAEAQRDHTPPPPLRSDSDDEYISTYLHGALTM